MHVVQRLYRHSLALLTDLYQLTMAYGYWKAGLAEHQAAFNLVFRKNPFQGGFTVACGLATALELLDGLRFDAEDIDYLASLTGADERTLFHRDFLDYLRRLEFACDLDAVPEGTVVFPHEPLLRVQGPLIPCQILETVLLNLVNFQSLIATKSARTCLAARGEPVIEFGLRRAQGIDGGLSASRAAFVGGCAATSNVLAGKLFGIPVKGTHAHSWVMCFDDELTSFEAYAQAMPNNCVFLVDTYDTLEGVRRAVQVGRRLREQGRELLGIRLDSGDLAYLSIEARKILDEGGFPNAQILASNDLDEHIISSLKEQHAAVGVWGVGTRLVTAYDQPALGGVYKLAAIRAPGGAWQHRIKLSEQAIKTSTPGQLQVRRYWAEQHPLADVIYDQLLGRGEGPFIDPLDPTRRKSLPADARHQDLLVGVLRAGRAVYQSPSLVEIREHAKKSLESFQPGIKRFVHAHQYAVGLDANLYDLKQRLILAARGVT